MYDCLMFEAQALLKLLAYVRSVKTEICGIGRLKRDQFDRTRVTDIRILPQVVGSVDANVTAEDMQAFFGSIPDEERKEWCFNWHTHPTFATTPSGTDLQNYRNLSELFGTFVPFIFNQQGQYNGYLYQDYPLKHIVEIKKIWIYEWRNDYKRGLIDNFTPQTQIGFLEALFQMTQMTLSQEDQEFIAAEVKAKLTNKVVVPVTSYSYGAYGNSGRYGGAYGGTYDAYNADNRSYTGADQKKTEAQSRWSETWPPQKTTVTPTTSSGASAGTNSQTLDDDQEEAANYEKRMAIYQRLTDGVDFYTCDLETLILYGNQWGYNWNGKTQTFWDRAENGRYTTKDIELVREELDEIYSEMAQDELDAKEALTPQTSDTPDFIYPAY